jgi:hypothetical protein
LTSSVIAFFIATTADEKTLSKKIFTRKNKK